MWWDKIVRIGITSLILIVGIIILGDLMDGGFGNRSLIEIIGDGIIGAINWIGDLINYIFFGE